MEITTERSTLIDITRNITFSIAHDISKGLNSGNREEIIIALERGIHSLGKLLVVTRWLGRNPVLHDIDTFNRVCQESIIQLHSIVKRLLKNGKKEIQQRTRFPEISIALEVLIKRTYPLPHIEIKQPNYKKIIHLLEQRIWRYYYIHYKQIQCDQIDIYGGMIFIHNKETFSCWITIQNPEIALLSNEIKWRIIKLTFFIPNEIKVEDKIIERINKDILNENGKEPIKILIEQLNIIAKNTHFNSILNECTTLINKNIFPKLKSIIETNGVEKILKIYYWGNTICLEYHLNNQTNTFRITHIPSKSIDFFNTSFSLEKQIIIIAQAMAEQINLEYMKELNYYSEKNSTNIFINLYTGNISFISPYLPPSLLNNYSIQLTKNPLENHHLIFDDIHILTQYAQIFTVAKILFINANFQLVENDIMKCIAEHTDKFVQIRGKIQISNCSIQQQHTTTTNNNNNNICGFPFKIQESESRCLCFIISKTPEENLICVGLRNKTVNYCSCSKEVFNSSLTSVEKIMKFCQESYSKYYSIIYLDFFKEEFSNQFKPPLCSIIINPLKNKNLCYFIITKYLPFVISLEQSSDDLYFYIFVDLNGWIDHFIDKFKPSFGTSFIIDSKKFKFSFKKENVEKDVQLLFIRVIQFIHLTLFLKNVFSKLLYFNEKTLFFDGYEIDFTSSLFDIIQFNIHFNEQYQYLSSFVHFEFTGTKEITSIKILNLKEIHQIVFVINTFVQYFDIIIKLLKSINRSCILLIISDLSSLTLFINPETHQISKEKSIILFSFDILLPTNYVQFTYLTEDIHNKKGFPNDVILTTLNLIPKKFTINEIEKYLKLLLNLIHLIIIIDYVSPSLLSKDIEERNHRFYFRADLFIKIPLTLSIGNITNAELFQTPRIDILTTYFNIRFSDPFNSGNLIHAKHLISFMSKKQMLLSHLSYMEPLISFCCSTLNKENVHHIYDFTFEDKNSVYYISVFIYHNIHDLIAQNSFFELNLQYSQLKVLSLLDNQKNTPLVLSFIEKFKEKNIATFRHLTNLLQDTFEK
ncbi:hypothetical protein EHI8A_030640 [Entamoeba histolytica HM-1:IMSS-B]|uniref:Uncharacterized protein n=1 Tax=Entamoeba histolytica HM-1:IMSS-B TaxID=885319 RepID=M3UHJ9_ENTH1|nr:hypothetical protein EHI8A_030640 [Entamoeba histolytica HM-1:IMSS-B]